MKTIQFRPYSNISQIISHIGSLSSTASLSLAVVLSFKESQQTDVISYLIVFGLVAVGISWLTHRSAKKKFPSMTYNSEDKEVLIEPGFEDYGMVNRVRLNLPVHPDSGSTINLRHDIETGVITLGNEHVRHVVLRTETIHRLLEAVMISTNNNLETLKEVGRKVGNDFGKVLQDFFEFHPKLDARSKLKIWFSYDRFGGMGYFHTRENPQQERPFYPPGEIIVDNAFVFRSGDNPRYCKFLEGYIQGVLEIIFGDYTWEVTITCPTTNHNRCRFTVQRIDPD